MKEEVKPINKRIAGYRKLAGYTQEDVAEILGLKRNTYARMEKHGNFNSDMLKKISELYKVPVEKILYGEIYNAPVETDTTANLRNPELGDNSDVFPLTAVEANAIRILRNLPKDKAKELMNALNEIFKQSK